MKIIISCSPYSTIQMSEVIRFLIITPLIACLFKVEHWTKPYSVFIY